MDKPCLVVMAAGMGSRYGGLKQMDPVDPQGHIIMGPGKSGKGFLSTLRHLFLSPLKPTVFPVS